MIEAIFNSLLFEQNIMFNPDIKRILNSKKVTDHHAIIPTMEIIKQDLKAIPESEMKILSLCANRLLCATGEKHIYNSTKAVITCNNTVFKVSGKEVWKMDGRNLRISSKIPIKPQRINRMQRKKRSCRSFVRA